MSKYDEVMYQYHDEVFISDKFSLAGDFKGFYDNGVILVDRDVKGPQKLEILFEEIAHHKYTWGDITDQSKFNNRKFENYARRAGYQAALPLRIIIEAYHYGISNLHELAEYVELSEEYIIKVIDFYKKKYGLSTYYNGYVIKFEPLQVFEYKNVE